MSSGSSTAARKGPNTGAPPTECGYNDALGKPRIAQHLRNVAARYTGPMAHALRATLLSQINDAK